MSCVTVPYWLVSPVVLAIQSCAAVSEHHKFAVRPGWYIWIPSSVARSCVPHLVKGDEDQVISTGAVIDSQNAYLKIKTFWGLDFLMTLYNIERMTWFYLEDSALRESCIPYLRSPRLHSPRLRSPRLRSPRLRSPRLRSPLFIILL